MEQITALAGEPAGEIELGQVERKLAELWAAAAPEHPEEQPAVLRACSLNLLVQGSDPAELERARPIAARTDSGAPLPHPPARSRGRRERAADCRSTPQFSRLTPDA